MVVNSPSALSLQISFPWKINILTIPSSQKQENAELTGCSGTKEWQNYCLLMTSFHTPSPTAPYTSIIPTQANLHTDFTQTLPKQLKKTKKGEEIGFFPHGIGNTTHIGLAREWEIVYVHVTWLTSKFMTEKSVNNRFKVLKISNFTRGCFASSGCFGKKPFRHVKLQKTLS